MSPSLVGWMDGWVRNELMELKRNDFDFLLLLGQYLVLFRHGFGWAI